MTKIQMPELAPCMEIHTYSRQELFVYQNDFSAANLLFPHHPQLDLPVKYLLVLKPQAVKQESPSMSQIK